MDPTAIQTADLTKTKVDLLAATVRKLLRRNHGFLERGSGVFRRCFDRANGRPHRLAL